jgi:TolB-like protein
MSHRTLLVLLSVAAAAVTPGSLDAQNTRPAFAILPFKDGGSYGQNEQIFRALELGIPALLASQLAASPALQVVDHTRIRTLLASADLGDHDRVDAGTAAQLGTAAGARYVVTGTFTDYFGRFRIDARIIDAASGQILTMVRNEDPARQNRQDLYQIIRLIGNKVLNATGLPPLPTDSTHSIPTAAITSFSRALLAETEGDSASAVRFYQQALQTAPDFAEASSGLQRLQP